MFGIYFVLSAAAIMATFGLPLAPLTRLYMYFAIGLSVFGVFGSFTYYLPELFPTRLARHGRGLLLQYRAGDCRRRAVSGRALSRRRARTP